MIPTFPLEEERDDIEDWLECFSMQMKLRHRRLEMKEEMEIKRVLTEKLGEEGIASKVQTFSINKEEEEDDCEFDGPAMDVILMVLDDSNGNDGASHYLPKQNSTSSSLLSRQSSLYGGLYTPTVDELKEEQQVRNDIMISSGEQQNQIIIGGAAVEYYKQSRVGLLSYVVLHSEYRGCGLAKYLHQEALSRLDKLSRCYGTSLLQGPTEMIPRTM